MRTRLVGMIAVMVLVVLFLSTSQVWSQSDADGGTVEGLKYFDFFVVKGGWIAYLLIVLSVVMLALTIEHGLSIRRATIVPAEAIEHTRELIHGKKYLEAIQFTADDPSMMGYILNTGLLEASNGYDAMERAVEDALDERSAGFFRKIEYLNVIGNVSPMIGLFGTVYGMILLFAEIHAADGLPGARIVADRMAVALITTFWGLAVAIPSLSIYALFRNRIDVLTAECALTADRMLSVFAPGSGEEPGHGSAETTPQASV
ncbi:MAG: MotA/TolQ/ExbB proton channel family protein [Planctomycetes bacterium]|nr:MotA/TolQ/ExbB proton channel family protein [Planctomycetota bacterium]